MHCDVTLTPDHKPTRVNVYLDNGLMGQSKVIDVDLETGQIRCKCNVSTVVNTRKRTVTVYMPLPSDVRNLEVRSATIVCNLRTGAVTVQGAESTRSLMRGTKTFCVLVSLEPTVDDQHHISKDLAGYRVTFDVSEYPFFHHLHPLIGRPRY
jgi:hypothetical protein